MNADRPNRLRPLLRALAGGLGGRRFAAPGGVVLSEVKNSRDLGFFVARISGVSVFLALSLDVFLQSTILFTSWTAAFLSWSGTVVITLLVAVPVTLVVGRAYRDLYWARQEVERLSRTDEMTGLANRRGFVETVRQLGTRSFVIAIVDIDLFKHVNDTHGHSAGDVVIKAVADGMRAVQAGRGTLCRLGGEEFVWLVPDGRPEDVFDAMNRARIAVGASRIRTGGADVRVTVSCGIAGAAPGSDIDAAYRAADRALYSAKGSGRNRVWMEGPAGPVFEPQMPTFDDLGWAEVGPGAAAA